MAAKSGNGWRDCGIWLSSYSSSNACLRSEKSMSDRENEVVAQVDAPKRDIGQAVTVGKQNKQIAAIPD